MALTFMGQSLKVDQWINVPFIIILVSHHSWLSQLKHAATYTVTKIIMITNQLFYQLDANVSVIILYSLFILVQKKCKAMDFCSITPYLGSTKYALKFALSFWALATSRSEDT